MSRFVRSRPRAVASLALLMLFGLAVGPSHALDTPDEPGGDSPSTWAVAPASQEGPDGRGRFDFTVEPGTRIEDYVAIRNLGEQPLTVAVYAQDAGQTQDTEFAVKTPDEAAERVGAWITLSENDVVIPPRDAVIIPFVLDLPQDAEPGDHAGGILAVSTIDQADSTTVSYATGTRVYVRVAGPADPSIAAEGLRPDYDGRIGPFSGGELRTDVTLVNTGNVRITPTSVVEVRSLFGLWTGTIPLTDAGEILPDGATTTTGTLEGVPPLGPYWLTVTTTEVLSRDQDVTSAVTTTSPTVLVWAVPWVLIGTLALLLLATLIAWRNLRRRRRIARALATATPEILETESAPGQSGDKGPDAELATTAPGQDED